MRPRRLSMEKGSELERSLAQELLGMGRAAERFIGEEEAEREVCARRNGLHTLALGSSGQLAVPGVRKAVFPP